MRYENKINPKKYYIDIKVISITHITAFQNSKVLTFVETKSKKIVLIIRSHYIITITNKF